MNTNTKKVVYLACYEECGDLSLPKIVRAYQENNVLISPYNKGEKLPIHYHKILNTTKEAMAFLTQEVRNTFNGVIDAVKPKKPKSSIKTVDIKKASSEDKPKNKPQMPARDKNGKFLPRTPKSPTA